MSCFSCSVFSCVYCLFIETMKLYKDIFSAWISCTSPEIFFSQTDVINVSKIKQIYCYFTENTSMDFWKVCVLLLLLLSLVTLSAISGISGNSEQKAILQTTEQLIQITVLEIQFRSQKYMTVIRIRQNLSNIPFLSWSKR